MMHGHTKHKIYPYYCALNRHNGDDIPHDFNLIITMYKRTDVASLLRAMYTIQVPASFISGYAVSERNQRKLPLRRWHLTAKRPWLKKSHSEGRC